MGFEAHALSSTTKDLVIWIAKQAAAQQMCYNYCVTAKWKSYKTNCEIQLSTITTVHTETKDNVVYLINYWYEGRPINKLQNGIILLIFKI